MKNLYKSTLISIVICVSLSPSYLLAFNPAAHIYIADRVFPNSSQENDFYYGSIAPDIALYVADPGKWPSAFEDTHYTYADLSVYAYDSVQEEFVKGWLTHNEQWGADYYAHIAYSGNPNKGYVIEKAEALLEVAGLSLHANLGFAHFAIEVAIDCLLKNDDSALGNKLLNANVSRSSDDYDLLEDVLVWREQRTDEETLETAEATFRSLVGSYAEALTLPTPQDKAALSDLGVVLAMTSYGIVTTPEELLAILEAAISLCEDDYKDVIDKAIADMTAFVNSDKYIIDGSITYDGTPLCALVLANGQYMFSCGGSLGSYDLAVPLDANGEITLYGFCSGFSPFKIILTPDQARDFDINMTRAAAGSREMEITMYTEPGTTDSDYVRVSGTVTYDETPLCAMVLANGQNMFSCGNSLGTFDLEVPLDGNGEITFYVFCSGMAPYKLVFSP